MEEPDVVFGPDVDDGRAHADASLSTSIRTSTGLRGHRPAALGVGADLLGQPLLERERPPQDRLELVGHELEVRPAAPRGLDDERLDGKAAFAGDVGGANVETAQGEHPGDRGQEPGPVARHHRDIRWLGGHDRPTEASRPGA